MYQQAKSVLLTLFPSTHFELKIADVEWERSYFFVDGEMLFY